MYTCYACCVEWQLSSPKALKPAFLHSRALYTYCKLLETESLWAITVVHCTLALCGVLGYVLNVNIKARTFPFALSPVNDTLSVACVLDIVPVRITMHFPRLSLELFAFLKNIIIELILMNCNVYAWLHMGHKTVLLICGKLTAMLKYVVFGFSLIVWQLSLLCQLHMTCGNWLETL